MRIETGLDLRAAFCLLGFEYGGDMFGPEPERRGPRRSGGPPSLKTDVWREFEPWPRRMELNG